MTNPNNHRASAKSLKDPVLLRRPEKYVHLTSKGRESAAGQHLNA
jgi:hypothetical protein